jgi:hypothetical protein
MNTVRLGDDKLSQPATRAALRSTRLLVGGYVGLSVLTLAAIIVMRHDAALVNPAVWTRGTIVVASALLMHEFAAGAARGSRLAFLRLRLASAIMVAAIAVIVALPDPLPGVDEDRSGLLRAHPDRRRCDRQRPAPALAVRQVSGGAALS